MREKNDTEKSESYGCLAARSHKSTVAVAGYSPLLTGTTLDG